MVFLRKSYFTVFFRNHFLPIYADQKDYNALGIKLGKQFQFGTFIAYCMADLVVFNFQIQLYLTFAVHGMFNNDG